MPSPEHEQFVALLTTGGSVLTPTSLPSSEALQEIRALEATADFTVPAGGRGAPPPGWASIGCGRGRFAEAFGRQAAVRRIGR
jgi:hypothetical protein